MIYTSGPFRWLFQSSIWGKFSLCSPTGFKLTIVLASASWVLYIKTRKQFAISVPRQVLQKVDHCYLKRRIVTRIALFCFIFFESVSLRRLAGLNLQRSVCFRIRSAGMTDERLARQSLLRRPWTSKGAFQAAMAAPVRLLWRHLSVFAALHGWRHEEQLWIRKFTYLLTACSFDLSHHQEETARSNIWGSSFTDAWFLCFWLDIWHWWSSWYYSFGRRLNPTITHSFVLLRQKTTQTTQGKSSFYSTHNTYLFLNVCICFIPVALLIYSFLAAWS